MENKINTTRIITLTLSGIFLLGAITALYLSWLSYDSLKSYVDSLSSDGTVESFTMERYQSINSKLKLATYTIIAIDILFFVFSKKISIYLSNIFTDAFNYFRSKKNSFAFIKKNENKFYLSILFVCTVIAFILRLHRLIQPINYDEAFSYIYFIKRPLAIGLSDYSYPNNHLFHTLLSHISCSIFGNDLWAIRLPAFIAGVLIIPFSFLLGKKLFNTEVGIIAALFCVVTGQLIDFSVIARGYTIETLLYLVSFLIAIDIKSKQKGAMFWFILICTLGIYTVPVYVQVMLIQTVYILWKGSNNLKKNTIALFIICITSFILYSPAIITSGLKAVIQNDSLQRLSISEMVRIWGKTLGWVASDWTRGFLVSGYWLVITGVLLSLLNKKNRLILLISVSVVITLSIIQQNVPPLRTWLHHIPVLLILSSAGIMFIVERTSVRFRNIVFTVILIIISTNIYSAYILEPIRYEEIAETESVAVYLKENLKEGDKVISVIPTDYPLEYYFMRQNIPVSYLRGENVNAVRTFVVINHASNETLSSTNALNDTSSVELVKHFKYADVFLW